MGLHCIRFGEIMLDENFRTFLLCSKCQTEFEDVPEFRVHLATSVCGEPFFRESVLTLKFGAATAKRANGPKQYLIYNPAEVQVTTRSAAPPSNTSSNATQKTAVDPVNVENATHDAVAAERDYSYFDLLKIEEELLDPRWYTDIAPPAEALNTSTPKATTPAATPPNKLLEYKELVEAVGPYVQFKENVKKPPNRCNAAAAAVLKKPQEAPALKANKRKLDSRIAAQAKPVLNSASQAAAAQAKTVLNPVSQAGAAVQTKTGLNATSQSATAQMKVKTVLNPASQAATVQTKTVLNPASQAAARLLNPTAKRKLCLPPKQAVLNETKALPKPTLPTPALTPLKAPHDNQLLKSCNKRTQPSTHQITKTNNTATDSPSPKRRKTLTIPLTQVHIHPEFQDQFGGSNLNNATAVPLKTYAKLTQTPRSAAVIKTEQQKSKSPVKPTLVPNPAATAAAVANTANTQVRAMKNVTASAPQLGRNKAALVNTPVSKVTSAVTATAGASAPVTAQGKSPAAALATVPSPSRQLVAAHQVSIAPARVQQTAAILNKLQTLGLQVKRTQPPNQAAPVAAITETAHNNNKMLELVKKLQSKGMNVKIVNGKQQLQTQTQTQAPKPNTASVDLTKSPAQAARKLQLNGAGADGLAPNAGKALLNSKLIIKKVK